MYVCGWYVERLAVYTGVQFCGMSTRGTVYSSSPGLGEVSSAWIMDAINHIRVRPGAWAT